MRNLRSSTGGEHLLAALRSLPQMGRAPKVRQDDIERLETRLLMSAWYVAPYGAAANPGTLAQPFVTIQEAANVAQPGDTVFIRGGVYHETVVPPASGLQGEPITFEAYNNEPVTIDGADAVTGWAKYSGSIYSATQSWDLGEGNNQVFVDGRMVNESRFPNTSLNISTPAWARATSVSVSLAVTGLSSFTINNAWLNQPAGAWVGALVHFTAGQEWTDQVGTVTDSSPGSITVSYQQATSYEVPKATNRFYIVGTFQALSGAGEFYRDPTSGQLYLWDPSGDNPTRHVIEAKARQYAFDLSGLSNITVEGIKLTACTINTDANSNGILLDHLTATYVSHSIGLTPDSALPWSAQYHDHTTGIILNGTGNVLQNSTIAYSSGDGVYVGGSGNSVLNCIIHDVDYEAGDEAGITVLGANEDIAHNTIYYTGRSGIVIRHTTASEVMHNIVHNVGMQTTDLGGIYTWGTDGVGTEIGYNTVYNIHAGGFGAAAIYLDNGSQNYVVDHNVTWNADIALKMNPPCWNDLIINNTFNANKYGLQSSGNEDMTGSILVNNIFNRRVMIGPGLMQSNNLFLADIPQFVSVPQNNYQLQATSPAIDAGMIHSPYTDNFTGAAPDIGAYEYAVPAFQSGQQPFVTSTPTVAASNAISDYFTPQRNSGSHNTWNSGDGICFAKAGSWVEFQQVDFGLGVQSLFAQVSNLPATSQRIQIRVDGLAGSPVGTLVLPATTQLSSVAQTLNAMVTGLSGIHDLYLVLIDPPAGGELDGFSFAAAQI